MDKIDTWKPCDPSKTEDVQLLKDTVWYWSQKCHYLKIEIEALEEILQENGVNPSVNDIWDKVNKKLASTPIDEIPRRISQDINIHES